MDSPFENFKQLLLGILITSFSVFGITYLIPNGIMVPKQVKSIFLSPNFWPSVIMYILGFLGIIIIIKHIFLIKKSGLSLSDILNPKVKSIFYRSIACGAILAISFIDIEAIGLPLSTTIVMFALYFLAEKKLNLVASLVMIITPWVLFFFFTHVASVLIPLGFFEWR